MAYCDGNTDNNLTPPSANKTLGVCAGAKKACDGLNGWVEPDYYSYSIYYQATEAGCDNKDNDCDGSDDTVNVYVKVYTSGQTSCSSYYSLNLGDE